MTALPPRAHHPQLNPHAQAALVPHNRTAAVLLPLALLAVALLLSPVARCLYLLVAARAARPHASPSLRVFARVLRAMAHSRIRRLALVPPLSVGALIAVFMAGADVSPAAASDSGHQRLGGLALGLIALQLLLPLRYGPVQWVLSPQQALLWHAWVGVAAAVLIAAHGIAYLLEWQFFALPLYILDRAIRLFNACTRAKVVDMKVWEEGRSRSGFSTVMLTIASSRFDGFRAGQFVYVKVPEISWIKWHPLSISTSPAANQKTRTKTNTVTVVHSGCGRFARGLSKAVTARQLNSDLSPPTVAVDGPYGGSRIHAHLGGL
ncbi:ferric/cupric-chelate reductase, partial [Entophlyctis sp. JEL0112]